MYLVIIIIWNSISTSCLSFCKSSCKWESHTGSREFCLSCKSYGPISLLWSRICIWWTIYVSMLNRAHFPQGDVHVLVHIVPMATCIHKHNSVFTLLWIMKHYITATNIILLSQSLHYFHKHYYTITIITLCSQTLLNSQKILCVHKHYIHKHYSVCTSIILHS